MGRVSLFHGTTKAAAGQICAHGFRDAPGAYMTSMGFTGVIGDENHRDVGSKALCRAVSNLSDCEMESQDSSRAWRPDSCLHVPQ